MATSRSCDTVNEETRLLPSVAPEANPTQDNLPPLATESNDALPASTASRKVDKGTLCLGILATIPLISLIVLLHAVVFYTPERVCYAIPRIDRYINALLPTLCGLLVLTPILYGCFANESGPSSYDPWKTYENRGLKPPGAKRRVVVNTAVDRPSGIIWTNKRRAAAVLLVANILLIVLPLIFAVPNWPKIMDCGNVIDREREHHKGQYKAAFD